MWSDINTNYVKDLVLSNRSEYPYYMAQTVSHIGSGSNYNTVTIKVYFSKEPITSSNGYTYKLPAGSICYSIIGSNGSNYSQNQRVTVSNVSGNITVEKYEFIYKKAETQTYTIHPDVTKTNAVTQSRFDGVSILILILLLANFTIRIFKS